MKLGNLIRKNYILYWYQMDMEETISQIVSVKKDKKI